MKNYLLIEFNDTTALNTPKKYILFNNNMFTLLLPKIFLRLLCLFKSNLCGV